MRGAFLPLLPLAWSLGLDLKIHYNSCCYAFKQKYYSNQLNIHTLDQPFIDLLFSNSFVLIRIG